MNSNFFGQGQLPDQNNPNGLSNLTKKIKRVSSPDVITVKKVRAYNNHLFRKKKLWSPDSAMNINYLSDNNPYYATNDNGKSSLEKSLNNIKKSISYAFRFLNALALGLVK